MSGTQLTTTDIDTRLTELETKVEEMFEDTEHLILLDNVRLQDALKNQIKLSLNWEKVYRQLCFLYDTCEHELEIAMAQAFENEMRNSYADVKSNEAKEYAKAKPECIEWRRLLNATRNVRDETRAIVDVITSRKYVLNNLTNAKVASVDNDIL